MASSQIMPKKRLVNGKTVTKGWGGNLQNIEKSMREIYIPDEGKIFVQTDQSGAEALIVSYLTRDGNYRALFKNGIKPHTYICVHLFKDIWPKKMRECGFLIGDMTIDMDEIIRTPIPELKNNPLWKSLDQCIKDSDNWALTERYYFLGKMTEHSSNYDIQPPTFRMNLLDKSGGKIVISKEQSEYFIATKHRLYPEIKEDFHAQVEREVKQNRIMYNLHGHPYCITQAYIKDSDMKEYYSWKPQSTVGEITNIAFTQMQNFIESENLDWDLLANTHDSFLVQCPISDVVICGQKSREFMNQKLISPFCGTEFAMKSESSAGMNWRPYHKDKNPMGLQELK